METPDCCPLSSGIFDKWLYAEIIKAALGHWTPKTYIQRNGSSPYRTSESDSHVLHFLASCCLVSKEWLDLARPLLYTSWRTGDCIAPEHTRTPSRSIVESHTIAPLVNYVGIHSYDSVAAAGMVSALPLFPNLRYLIVSEGSYPFTSFRYIPSYEGKNLTKLSYRSGSVQDLARLLAVLPHLKELKAGLFMYAMKSLPPEEITITCKLESVTLFHSPRYVTDLFEWMFESSKDSIQHFTVLRSPKIFKDAYACFVNARTLTIELKKIANLAKYNMDPYELGKNLASFTKLEKLTLRVPHDCPTQMHNSIYASLKQQYPKLDIRYHRLGVPPQNKYETSSSDACD